MANPRHLALVKKGSAAINEWTGKHFHSRLNLEHAKLRGVDLSEARLYMPNILGADLSDGNLSGANFLMANLTIADLTGANLTGADLTVANLTRAKLTEANLLLAKVSGADLIDAVMGGTAVVECSLAQCLGLDTVEHKWPSSIGVDTLVESFRGAGSRLTPELETFFLNAGVPRELLTALPTILAEVQYCTTFVCYGEPDRAFAERLVRDLKARGVSCWLYSMDATPGEPIWREIGRKRRESEKMVVLCSAPALVRDGALKEIEEQVDEAPDKMVPVSLEDLWREEGFRVMRGQRNLKSFLEDRNWADFSDESAYEASLERLLTGLRRKDTQAS